MSGKVLAKSEVSVANKQDILNRLPKLAAPIRKALGDTTPASVQFEEVSGGFKAASLEAVHEVSIGVDEQFEGKFQEAFDSFQKAAQLDPNFTWPYTGMAAMDQNLGKSEDAVKYMKLAMEHVDNMTEREAYRDRGLYYLTTGDWQDCVQEYTQLVTRFPADRVGQNNLATCYTQLRNAPKALEAAKQAVEIVPKGVGPRLNLAFISSFAGDFADSEKEAQTALAINPNAALGYLVMAEANSVRVRSTSRPIHTISLRGLDPLLRRPRPLDSPIFPLIRGNMQRPRAFLRREPQPMSWPRILTVPPGSTLRSRTSRKSRENKRQRSLTLIKR